MELNKFQERIFETGRKKNAKLVLPEIGDPRVSLAKRKLSDFGFKFIETQDFRKNENQYRETLEQKHFFKKMSEEAKKNFMINELNFSMMMLSSGDADGVIAGAVNSTSDVLRAAIRIVGINPKAKWVSSSFFMISPRGENAYTFADCGVIPEPTSYQLASIAGESAKLHRLLTGDEPRVAFLSFSTKGSASHRRVSHVRNAVETFGELYPEFIHDGELQVDSAIEPSIAAIKAKNSPLHGNASVLIFPSLEAGNIAYKITERFAGYSAWGPLLQGLKKPAHDLSRGCSSEDIVNVAAIAALQSD